MRKIVLTLLVVSALAAAAFGQNNRATRPRIVATPTPEQRQTPPILGNDPDQNSSSRRPPVLTGGGIGPSKPAETPANDKKTDVITDDEIIKVETTMVTMPVSVLDREGRFVSGLQQRDFKIFENGVEQKLEYFASVEKPFTVVLLIDVSPSTQYKIDEIQDAAIAFVNQLRRDDRVAVISFDERIHVLAAPTNNRNVLRNAIMEARFGDGTSLYEAVDQTINQYLKRIDGRKAVVLFTDGVDTTSRRASYQSTIAEVEELDALFYTIRYDTAADMNGGYGGGGYPGGGRRRGGGWGDMIGIVLGGGQFPSGGGRGSGRGRAGSSSQEYETGRRYLQTLAQNSGGRSFDATTINNLDAAFSGIAEELRRQYSIGYYPETVGQAGERRQIRVRVDRPNLVVRAKASYIVGQNTGSMAGK